MLKIIFIFDLYYIHENFECNRTMINPKHPRYYNFQEGFKNKSDGI